MPDINEIVDNLFYPDRGASCSVGPGCAVIISLILIGVGAIIMYQVMSLGLLTIIQKGL